MWPRRSIVDPDCTKAKKFVMPRMSMSAMSDRLPNVTPCHGMADAVGMPAPNVPLTTTLADAPGTPLGTLLPWALKHDQLPGFAMSPSPACPVHDALVTSRESSATS